MGPQVVRRTFEPRPYGGSALRIAAHLDGASPGFLLASFYSSSLKRQALFAAFTTIDLNQPKHFVGGLAEVAPETLIGTSDLDPLARIARALITLRAKPIIEATYGSCPPGLLGLLARVGADPLRPQSTYRVAHSIYSDPHLRARANILRQTPGEITAAKIAIVAGLDDLLAHRAIVDRVYDQEQVAGLHRLLPMLRQQCDATDAQITASLDALPAKQGDTLRGWVQGWVRKQVRASVPPPISAEDADFRLLLGADLEVTSRTFRNCLSTRLPQAFAAEHVYYRWTGAPGPEAIVELHPMADGDRRRWAVEDVRLVRNGAPEGATATAIRAALARHGILFRTSAESGPGSKGLRRLLDIWSWGGFGDEDEEEHAPEGQTAEQVLADLDRLVNGHAAEAA